MKNENVKPITKEDLLAKTPMQLVDTILTNPEAPRLSPKDVANILKDKDRALELYEACKQANDELGRAPVTFTAALSEMLGRDEDGLDGFQQLLRYLNIPLKNDPDRGVFVGDVNSLFFNSKVGAAIAPEYISRTMRKAAEAASYSVKGLIADHVYTPNGTYTEPTLDTDNIDAEVGDVGEGGEFPEITLATSEVSKNLKKVGCSFKTSYEAVKRIKINQFALALKRIGLSFRSTIMKKFITVAMNGAGTTQAKHAINSGDAAGNNSIQYKTWLLFTAEENGRKYDKVFGSLKTVVEVLLAAKPSVDPIQLMAEFAKDKKKITGENIHIQDKQWSDVELIVHPSMVDWTLMAIDSEYAVVQVSETDSTIVETEKIISRQLNGLVFSTSTDFYVSDAKAIKIMTGI